MNYPNGHLIDHLQRLDKCYNTAREQKLSYIQGLNHKINGVHLGPDAYDMFIHYVEGRPSPYPPEKLAKAQGDIARLRRYPVDSKGHPGPDVIHALKHILGLYWNKTHTGFWQRTHYQFKIDRLIGSAEFEISTIAGLSAEQKEAIHQALEKLHVQLSR